MIGEGANPKHGENLLDNIHLPRGDDIHYIQHMQIATHTILYNTMQTHSMQYTYTIQTYILYNALNTTHIYFVISDIYYTSKNTFRYFTFSLVTTI